MKGVERRRARRGESSVERMVAAVEEDCWILRVVYGWLQRNGMKKLKLQNLESKKDGRLILEARG